MTSLQRCRAVMTSCQPRSSRCLQLGVGPEDHFGPQPRRSPKPPAEAYTLNPKIIQAHVTRAAQRSGCLIRPKGPLQGQVVTPFTNLA